MLTIEQIDLQQIDAAIFDFDGTIYCKRWLPFRLTMGQIRRLKLVTFVSERLARKWIRGRSYESEEAFYEAFFSFIGWGTKWGAKRAKTWYVEQYLPFMVGVLQRHYTADPKVLELMRQLRAAGKKVAVYSDYERAADRLRAIGADPELATLVVSSPTLGGLKPSEGAIKQLVKRLDVDPKRCLILGDSNKADGGAARAIGAQFYLVTNHE